MEQRYRSIAGDLILAKVFSPRVLYSGSLGHILAYSERIWRQREVTQREYRSPRTAPAQHQSKKASTPHLWDLQRQPLPQHLLITNCKLNWLAVTLRSVIDPRTSLGTDKINSSIGPRRRSSIHKRPSCAYFFPKGNVSLRACRPCEIIKKCVTCVGLHGSSHDHILKFYRISLNQMIRGNINLVVWMCQPQTTNYFHKMIVLI